MAVKQNPPQDFRIICNMQTHTHCLTSLSMYHFELQSCMDIFISHLFCCTMPENLYNTYIFFHKKEIITPYQFWCKKYKFVVEQNTDCSIWFKSIYGSEKGDIQMPQLEQKVRIPTNLPITQLELQLPCLCGGNMLLKTVTSLDFKYVLPLL